MFSWVQNKLINRRSRNKKQPSFINPPPADQNEGGGSIQREEYALLAIGTFGLKSMKDDDTLQEAGNDEDSEETLTDTAAVIGKKSLSYLLNKFLACGGGGFAVPSGPILHSESRLDKILRKILEKKVHPQGTYPASRVPVAAPKYLMGCNENEHYDDETHNPHHKPIQDSKWVNTDTDYIVLEV